MVGSVIADAYVSGHSESTRGHARLTRGLAWCNSPFARDVLQASQWRRARRTIRRQFEHL